MTQLASCYSITGFFMSRNPAEAVTQYYPLTENKNPLLFRMVSGELLPASVLWWHGNFCSPIRYCLSYRLNIHCQEKKPLCCLKGRIGTPSSAYPSCHVNVAHELPARRPYVMQLYHLPVRGIWQRAGC